MHLFDPIRIAEYDNIIREVLASGGEFRIYPRGTSMLPLLRQGVDSVVLRAMERAPKKNDILFYQRKDGSYILHRVKKVIADGLIMWGDNQTVFEYGVKEEQIIGYVARIFRGERELNPKNFLYRAYLSVWCFMFVRKYIFAFIYFINGRRGSHNVKD